MILVYDGSFNGFLTAMHFALENNMEVLGFQKNGLDQEGLFTDRLIIATQKTKALELWESLEKKSHPAIRTIYFSFLSEAIGIDFMLYQYIRKLYGLLDMEGMEQVVMVESKINKLAHQVHREKSYIESSLVFPNTDTSVYFTELASDYNVLPLISRHFRYKYPKHPWIIFDRNRKYGVYYNGMTLEMISEQSKERYLKTKMPFPQNRENSYRMAM